MSENDKIFLHKKQTNSIRGIAALMILVAHYVNRINTSSVLEMHIPLLDKMGRYGVVIFFVCSGYGLMESYKRYQSLDGFAGKRFRTVFGPYLIVQLLFAFILPLKSDEAGSMWEMIVRWFSGVEHWYIFVSLVLYILFFAVVKYAKKRICLWVIIGITLFDILLIVLQIPDYWYMSNYTFCVGIILSVYKEKMQKHISIRNLLCTLILFAVSSVIYAKLSEIWPIYFVFKNLSAVVWSIAVIQMLCYMPLKSTLLERLGKCSLFIYVIHMNVLEYMSLRNIEEIRFLIVSVCIVFVLSLVLDKAIKCVPIVTKNNLWRKSK